MKKLYRIFLTMLLLASMTFASIPVLAFDNSTEVDISGLDLNLLKESMENDPLIQEVSLEGNILYFTTADGKISSISVQQINGVETVTVIENGKEDVITADLNSNEVFLNNEPVQISIEEGTKIPEIMPYTDWTFLGTSYPNVVAEKAIRDLNVSVLVAIVLYATGNYGFTYEAATLVWNRIWALGSTTNTLYVRRMTFRDPTWTLMKYNDNYFANGNYNDAGWLHVVEYEFAGGTR